MIDPCPKVHNSLENLFYRKQLASSTYKSWKHIKSMNILQINIYSESAFSIICVLNPAAVG